MKDLLSDAQICFPLVLMFINSFTWSELEPILALRLKEYYELTQFQIGLFLSLMTVGQFIGSVFI